MKGRGDRKRESISEEERNGEKKKGSKRKD